MADDDYLGGAQMMLSSLARHTKPLPTIRALYHQRINHDAFAALGVSEFWPILAENYGQVPGDVLPHLVKSIYKLDVFRFAPTLYIDCDILWHKDITPLLMHEPKADIAAVWSHHTTKWEYNCGVMAIKNNKYKELLALMETTPSAKLADQTVINLAIKRGRMTAEQIHPRWNTTIRDEARGKRGNCTHYVGANKPWHTRLDQEKQGEK